MEATAVHQMHSALINFMDSNANVMMDTEVMAKRVLILTNVEKEMFNVKIMRNARIPRGHIYVFVCLVSLSMVINALILMNVIYLHAVIMLLVSITMVHSHVSVLLD